MVVRYFGIVLCMALVAIMGAVLVQRAVDQRAHELASCKHMIMAGTAEWDQCMQVDR